jgi:hypothetical protein
MMSNRRLISHGVGIIETIKECRHVHMLIKTKELIKFKTRSKDNVIGTIYDMYFDDLTWTIQYMLINLRGSPENNYELVSNNVFGKLNFPEKHLPLVIKLQGKDEKVKSDFADLPVKSVLKPVRYSMVGIDFESMPIAEVENTINAKIMNHKESSEILNLHLRSLKGIFRYVIRTKNGDIGWFDDFLLETDDWNIKYMLVDTKNWLSNNEERLISLAWIEKIKWKENIVYLDMDKEVVRNSPVYNSNIPLDREFERILHRYYIKQSKLK